MLFRSLNRQGGGGNAPTNLEAGFKSSSIGGIRSDKDSEWFEGIENCSERIRPMPLGPEDS